MIHSRNHWKELALLASLVLIFNRASEAQQAVVRSLSNAQAEVGQAFLAHSNGNCLSIVPTHVVAEAGSPLNLRREGREEIYGEALDLVDLGRDLSVGIVKGALSRECGYGLATISRDVERRVRNGGVAMLRTIGAAGGIRQISVTVIDDGGTGELWIQPTHPRDELKKGFSGSTLFVADAPIGILLSVKRDRGKVLRIDRALAAVEAHLRDANVRADGPEGDAKPIAARRSLDVRSSGSGPSVVGWSVLPIDDTHRATNLLATEGAAPWVADATKWPVDLEIDLDGRVAITEVVLEAGAVDDPAQLPAAVEILINGREGTPRWRSIVGQQVEFRDGIVRIVFAPTWARGIKIRFNAVQGNGTRIALGRIGIVKR